VPDRSLNLFDRFIDKLAPEPTYDDAQIITIALAAENWFGGDEEKTLHYTERK
jgi:hypothetical protein